MIVLSPQKFARILTCVALALGMASLVGHYWTYVPVEDGLVVEIRESFVRLFNVDGEANFPAWFSSSLLLLCSLLLAITASCKKQAGDPHARHWGGLALIFLCLSIDEAAVIHEMAIKPLQWARNFGGLFYEAWVIPGAAFVVVLALSYWKFLMALPRETRRHFLMAGTLFVGGAIGVETLGGLYVSQYGRGTPSYQVIIVVEELCEMLGATAFAYALMEHLRGHVRDVGFQFRNAKVVPADRLGHQRQPEPSVTA